MTVKQVGFNLVELMISLVAGIVLMTSITTMFVDTKVSANRSLTVASLQQQAQLALQVLVEDVRSIGSWAEFSGVSLGDIAVPAFAVPADSCSVVPIAGSTTAENRHKPETANWIRNSNALPATALSIGNCLDAEYNIAINSDVLSVSRLQGTVTAVADLVGERYYVAVSPLEAQLFKGNTPNGATNIDNAEMYPYLHHIYLVQTHDTEDSRLSRFSFIEGDFVEDLVVGNIEQIRIDLGVDTNSDGRPESYQVSNSITELMWRTNQIVAARIYVLARAKDKDLTLNNNAEFNDRFSPFNPPDNDNYRRFLLSTTVLINNNMMVAAQ
jgi:type IV pilus assembly protein PilW